MKKFTSSLHSFHQGNLRKPFALIAFFICYLIPATVKSQAARLDQWQKLDAAWEYGNLNKRHSNYTEGESVPYRIFVSGLTDGVQSTLIISFDITGTNHSPVKHGIDYLTSFDATIGNPPFDDATVFGDVPNSFTVPAGPLAIEPIPAPSNLAYLAGVSQGNMILNGGTIDEIIYTDEGDPSVKNEKAFVRIKFTPVGTTDVVFLYGGHLARDEDYTGDDNGAGGIHGSPYHMRLASITGNQDRSVQVGLACDLPVEGSCELDAKCETTAGGGTAHFDLTSCSSIGSGYTGITWYDGNDDPIADPTDYVGSDGEVVYAVLSNDCGLSSPIYVTLHVNSLPTLTCPSDFSACINASAFALTGASPSGGTYSGDGVSGGNFDPATAGVGPHTITYTYTDGNTTCSNTCTFTITVNPLPTFGTITSTSTCLGSSNGTITLASCEANTNYQLKKCSDNSSVQGVKTCSNGTVVWNGLAAGCYYIVATNTQTECSNTSGNTTVVGAVCNTTLTQGFYGNAGGKDCNNKTALQIITAAVGGSNKLFGAGCRSFTLKPSDLTGSKPNIFKMLPGGSTPYVLGCVPASGSGANACLSGTATFDCKPSWQYVPIQNGGAQDGSINNVLLAQTMAMFFNLSNSANLGTIKIEGNKLTFNYLACGAGTPGAFASIQYIPCTVFNYLNANYAGAGHPNINDLYDLANKVLGNVVNTISASDMNAALNAINVGFDKGKALMSQEITCAGYVTRINSQIMNEVVVEQPTITAYPNPFNDKVRFVLQTAQSGKASLDIYNMLGQKVKTVFEGQLFANTPQTVEYKTPALAPASNLIYIFRINGKQVTGKLINIKN